MDEQLRIILIIIVSVSIFGLLVFVFVKNYIRNKINLLVKEEKDKKSKQIYYFQIFIFFYFPGRAACAEKCGLIAFMAVMRDCRRIPGQPIQFVQCLFHRIRMLVEQSRIDGIVSPSVTADRIDLPRGLAGRRGVAYE